MWTNLSWFVKAAVSRSFNISKIFLVLWCCCPGGVRSWGRQHQEERMLRAPVVQEGQRAIRLGRGTSKESKSTNKHGKINLDQISGKKKKKLIKWLWDKINQGSCKERDVWTHGASESHVNNWSYAAKCVLLNETSAPRLTVHSMHRFLLALKRLPIHWTASGNYVTSCHQVQLTTW